MSTTIGASRCQNCDAGLEGEWCHECGQNARSPIQPVPVLVRELGRELLDLDNRVLRSLRTLMLRPGFLTLEYVAGRRQRWTTPLRLYLLATLVYFVVASLVETRSFLFITNTDQTSVMVEWLPRVLAIVVPAFAFFDYLLFGRRGLWAESLVFSLHLHAGWFVLATVTALGQPLVPVSFNEPWAWYQILIAVPVAASQIGIWVYAWMALRRFHDRGWFVTTRRLIALVLLHTLTTAMILLLILSLLP